MIVGGSVDVSNNAAIGASTNIESSLILSGGTLQYAGAGSTTDRLFRLSGASTIDASGTMKGLDTFTTRAFDMVASGTVRKALDLSREEPRTRDRYKGVEQFLTARRD